MQNLETRKMHLKGGAALEEQEKEKVGDQEEGGEGKRVKELGRSLKS